MRSRLFALACLLALVGWSTAAHATCYADFEGTCTWNNVSVADCSFSADLPLSAPSACSGSSIYSYDWSFGDGGTANTATPSHSYANPGSAGAFTVTLNILCSDRSSCSRTRYVCFTLGTMGCIAYGVGWN